jgi:pimeloyl-ACP methyl ester carboxylesterase
MKKLILILFLSLTVLGCSSEQILTNIDETIVVRSNGADMPVYIHGNLSSNVIVVFVHGGPGGNGLEYRSGRFAEELEQNYAVAYWDQRGQGMSQGKFLKEDYTVQQMADDLHAVIQVLKVKYSTNPSIFILGHSWGGMLTAKFVTTDDYQDDIAGWITSNGAHDIPLLNREAIALFLSVADEQTIAGNNINYWNEIKSWAAAIDTNNITLEQGGEINQKAFEAEERLYQDGIIVFEGDGGLRNPVLNGRVNPITSLITGSIASDALLEEVEQTSLTAELNKVTLPTLILTGKYDFVVPPKLGVSAFNAISSTNKYYQEFEKSGHSPMDNEWQPYTQALIDFIELYR